MVIIQKLDRSKWVIKSYSAIMFVPTTDGIKIVFTTPDGNTGSFPVKDIANIHED